MTSAAFAFFVAPVALTTEDATLRSAITPCPLFPVQEEVGVRLEQTEIRHLTSQLGWTNPVGLFGYSRNGYYKDLWLYFNRADTTSTVNEMADRAFRMYGLGGAQVFQKPTFKPIRGVVIIMRLEPDPNFCPPPPFKYQPALALEDVYDTLVFFRDVKKSAHTIAKKRDAQRLMQSQSMRNAPPGATYFGAAGTRSAAGVKRDMEQCAHCRKTKAIAGTLKWCPCHLVKYCCEGCQKSDRKQHKKECQKVMKTKPKKKKKL
jgi:hypothetical protein